MFFTGQLGASLWQVSRFRIFKFVIYINVAKLPNSTSVKFHSLNSVTYILRLYGISNIQHNV